MGSTFYGLSVAQTGLAAQRRALETAGHNIANANTDGYSRQRVDLASISGAGSGINVGSFSSGNGVDVVGQNRIVDQFLINRVNTERATLGQYEERQTTLSRLELSFGEPGDNGLSSQMDAFRSAWDTVAMTPEDEAARASLLQRGQAIGDSFQNLTRQFDTMSDDVLQRGAALVVEVNGKAAQIADLNLAISAAMEAGVPPNDLLDQRDQIVRQLSEFVGVSTHQGDNGHLQVNIGGASLVMGGRANSISLDDSVPGGAVLRINTSSVPLNTTGGRLEGLLESANVLIPDAQAGLDALAVQLRDLINGQHALGQDLDLNAGGDFFTGTSARDFALAPAVDGNPRAVAAAVAGAGRYDGNNAISMAELIGVTGGPDDTYRSLIANIGVAAQTANQRLDLQSELTAQVDAQRESVSGVSIDEEMAQLVAFQQAYDASARFLTTIDEMLERLINGTGTVGR